MEKQKYLVINNVNISEDDVKSLIKENKRYQEKERDDRIFKAIENLSDKTFKAIENLDNKVTKSITDLDNKVTKSITDLKTELKEEIMEVKKDIEGVKKDMEINTRDIKIWTFGVITSVVIFCSSAVVTILKLFPYVVHG